MSMFQKAERRQRKLRLALLGPSGSGKTMSALRIARGIAGKDGRIALLDTEHASAALYADAVDFDTVELESFEPQKYMDVVYAACSEGYDVLVIDSLSHAWAGKGGILEFVDATAKRSQSGSSFNAWRDATPVHNQLVETLTSAPIHLIVTMRTKMEHVQEKDEKTGRTVIRKVGMQPVQREGLEYEFDVVGDMQLPDNLFVISKTRYSGLASAAIDKPGEDLGTQLAAWLNSGAPAPDPSLAATLYADFKGLSEDEQREFIALAREVGVVTPAMKKASEMMGAIHTKTQETTISAARTKLIALGVEKDETQSDAQQTLETAGAPS